MIFALIVVFAVCAQALGNQIVFPSSWEEFDTKYSRSMENLFKDFKTEFGKKYNDENNEKVHFENFREKAKEVFSFNAKKLSWYKGINRFTDMSDEELNSFVMPETKVDPSRAKLSGKRKGLVGDAAPKSKPLQGAGNSEVCDLRPFMTSVKDQGSCGSCWSFGTVAAAEASHQLWSMTDAKGKPVPTSLNNAWQISEQTIIECCGEEYDSAGCGGGGVSGPMQCAVDIATLPSTVSNPYLATTTNTTCSYTGTQAAAVVDAWYEPCGNGDEACVKSYIGGDSCATFYTTALKTSIEVISSFYSYAGGVYSDPNCPNTIHNHAVAIVGWGTTAAGEDYWIVRNSWGSSWGQNGYFLMQRGTNMCCVACENLFFQ